MKQDKDDYRRLIENMSKSSWITNIRDRLFLTEDRLYDIIRLIFPGSNIAREKYLQVENRRFKIDIFIEDKNLFVEFDGYHHFTKASQIIRDCIVSNYILFELKSNLIRIPYFVQLDSTSLRYYFDLYKEEIETFISKYNISDIPAYPHGFIDKKAVLPADFCTKGMQEFEFLLQELPERIRNGILKSLKDKIDELGNVELVVPIEFYNKYLK